MPPKPTLRINRFVVMAMLQTARAQRLGLNLAAARSWGLNRAIFYAAAKRGFRARHEGEPTGHEEAKPTSTTADTFHLGNELAYRDPTDPEPRFTIGGKVQTDADFRRQIAARFGTAENFRNAWSECQKVVGEYDRDTLGSRSKFYSTVYQPRRDFLVQEWTERFRQGTNGQDSARASPP